MREFLKEWQSVMTPLSNLLPLFIIHLSRRMLSGSAARVIYYLLLGSYSLFLVGRFVEFASYTEIRFFELATATLVYAGFLFVLLSELLLTGLAPVLTKWRGEVWAKEIDYFYLSLGAVGLAMSTNRLDIVNQKLSVPEFIGPFVIATALVIRAIKTRVEINGWNKLQQQV